MHLNNDKLKQSIFVVTLLALAAFLLWLLWGFVNAFLGAVVFYILLRRPLFYLTEKAKRKWPKAIAILLLMFASFVVLILPVILISLMLSGKISYLINHYQDILVLAQRWNGTAQQYFGVDLLSPETVGKLTTLAANVIPGFLSATIGAVIDIFILYFVLYFMMDNARRMESFVRENLPFSAENNKLLISELRIQTVTNAIGIPVLAVLQALTALLGYYFLQVDQPLFWAVVTGLMSMLPVVGTTIVWVPLAIILYAGGKHWQGLALAGYGALIITNIDNVLRFMMQKRLGDIHPLITFFGVLIGLPLFGFVGIIFGPLLISYFILLLKIYRNEYFEVKIIPPTQKQ